MLPGPGQVGVLAGLLRLLAVFLDPSFDGSCKAYPGLHHQRRSVAQ